MSTQLHGKNILYIGQKFFGYENEIKLAIEMMGASVDYFDERPNNTFLTKVLLRFKMNKFIKKKINLHYDNILYETKDKQYDYVFINKLETIDLDIITRLKSNNSSAKFILYMWDSIDNYTPNIDTLNVFDRALSFDTKDVENISKLELLPLFYIPIYQNIDTEDVKYDLTFIGSGHSDRYQIVSHLSLDARQKGLSVYSFFYLRTKIMFYFRKLFDKRLRGANINEFSFVSLTQNQIVTTVASSNAIIDIEHPTHQGLTMRSIEMLGARKKLITTNENIKKYDFYNPNNIYVLDRNNPKLDIDFLKLPYHKPEQDIYEKYSLENWIKTIFGITNNSYLNSGTIEDDI